MLTENNNTTAEIFPFMNKMDIHFVDQRSPAHQPYERKDWGLLKNSNSLCNT